MGRQNWRAGNMLYPVPAVMVACARQGEAPNIITIAWAGTICSAPAMLSISIRPERFSYDIIRQTGEFTVNLVTPGLVRAADYCGVRSGRQVDKFREMKLTAIPSEKIAAPGIGESPVILECKVRQILELGTHHMFVAEVVNVSVDESQMDENGKFQLNRLGLAVYSHGEYFALGQMLGKFGYSVQRQKPVKRTTEGDEREPAGKKPQTGSQTNGKRKPRPESGKKKNGLSKKKKAKGITKY